VSKSAILSAPVDASVTGLAFDRNAIVQSVRTVTALRQCTANFCPVARNRNRLRWPARWLSEAAGSPSKRFPCHLAGHVEITTWFFDECRAKRKAEPCRVSPLGSISHGSKSRDHFRFLGGIPYPCPPAGKKRQSGLHLAFPFRSCLPSGSHHALRLIVQDDFAQLLQSPRWSLPPGRIVCAPRRASAGLASLGLWPSDFDAGSDHLASGRTGTDDRLESRREKSAQTTQSASVTDALGITIDALLMPFACGYFALTEVGPALKHVSGLFGDCANACANHPSARLQIAARSWGQCALGESLTKTMTPVMRRPCHRGCRVGIMPRTRPSAPIVRTSNCFSSTASGARRIASLLTSEFSPQPP